MNNNNIFEIDEWKDMLSYFYLKGKITEKCKDKLGCLLSTKEINSLINRIETEEEIEVIKERIRCSLEMLQELYEKRNEPQDKEYERLRKSLSVNEKKYVEDSYERVKEHLFLYQIFKNQYEFLYLHIKNQISFQRYGKYGNKGEYHCPSPTLDLIVQNISRGRLYKRMPKDMYNKAEYSYDGQGRLIMFRWYINESRWYFTEFLLYGETEIIHIRYGEEKTGYRIEKIIIQSYQGENHKKF